MVSAAKTASPSPSAFTVEAWIWIGVWHDDMECHYLCRHQLRRRDCERPGWSLEYVARSGYYGNGNRRPCFVFTLLGVYSFFVDAVEVPIEQWITQLSFRARQNNTPILNGQRRARSPNRTRPRSCRCG